MIENVFCKIYVFASCSFNELCNDIARWYQVADGGKEIHLPRFEISILNNPDFNAMDAIAYPDGFLYFPYYVEITFDDNVETNFMSQETSSLLLHFWEAKMSAVASCDYEALLPHKGGYNSTAIPWPQ